MSRERLLVLYCLAVGGGGWLWLLSGAGWNIPLLPALLFLVLALIVDILSLRVPPLDPLSLRGMVLFTAVLTLGPAPGAFVAACEGLLFGMLLPFLYRRPRTFYTLVARPVLRSGVLAAALLGGGRLATALAGVADGPGWFLALDTGAQLLALPAMIAVYTALVQLGRSGRELLQGGRSGLLTWWRSSWRMILLVEIAPLPLATLGAAIYEDLGTGYFLLASAALVAASIVVRRAAMNLQSQRRSVRELALLNEVSRAIIRSELNTAALGELIYREASKIVDTSSFHLGLFDGASYTLLVRVQDRVRLPLTTYNLEAGDGIIGWMRQTGRALLVEDFALEMDRLPARPRYQSDRPPRSGIYVPLIAGDAVIGSISVQSYRPHAFGPNDLRLLSLIADQAAVAFARARAFHEARQRAVQLQAIHEVSERVTAILNLEELLVSVVRLIREHFGYHPVHIFTVDPLGERIVFRASTAHDEHAHGLQGTFMRLGEGIVGSAAASGQPILVGDVHCDARYISDNSATRSELAVPLRIGAQVVGVLDVQSDQHDDFDDDDLFVIRTLADQIAIAIDSANSYAAQQEEAWTLNALFQVAENTGRATTRDELLAMIVRLPPLLSGCDRCLCLLWEREHERFRLVAGYGLDQEHRTALLGLTIEPAEAPLLARLRDELRPIEIHNVQAQRAQCPPIVEFCGSGTLLALPMLARSSLLGALLIDYNAPNQALAPRQMALYAGAAGQMAGALENALLAQEAAEAARLEQELRVAREIQTDLLPAALPAVAGWEIAADWRSARLVGGDFYDFWWLRQPADDGPRPQAHEPSSTLGFVIADVSDKGVPAAMFMALSRSLVRAAALDGSPPATALQRANRWIARDSESGMFVTLFYGVLDTASGALRYTCAGHNPPLLYRAADGAFENLWTAGIALGVLEEVQLHEAQTVLEPGDLLTCYTDGVTEAINEAFEEFGTARLRQIIARNAADGVNAVSHAITGAVTSFTSGQPPFDDVTLVVLQRLT